MAPERNSHSFYVCTSATAPYSALPHPRVARPLYVFPQYRFVSHTSKHRLDTTQRIRHDTEHAKVRQCEPGNVLFVQHDGAVQAFSGS